MAWKWCAVVWSAFLGGMVCWVRGGGKSAYKIGKDGGNKGNKNDAVSCNAKLQLTENGNGLRWVA